MSRRRCAGSAPGQRQSRRTPGRRKPERRHEPDPARPHPTLSASDLAAAAAELPLFAELFGVRRRGDCNAWRGCRQRARPAPHPALSPMGRQRLRSGSAASAGAGIAAAPPDLLSLRPGMDQQQRNLVIAIALSLAILFAFQYFFARPQQQQAQQEAAPATATAPVPQRAAPTVPGMEGLAPADAAPRDKVLAAGPRAKIATPRLNGSIDLVGARLDDLTLVNYRETVDPQSPEIVLLAPDGTTQPYFVQFGW